MIKVYYRLPYQDVYTQIVSDAEPLELASYAELGNRAGFVVAPFNITDSTPLLLIPQPYGGNGLTTLAVPQENGEMALVATDEHGDKTSYLRDFGLFHDSVADGSFIKLVLSRTKCVALADKPDIDRLFFHLCHVYPRAMVMMFSTPQTGTWLVASPEILVETQRSNLCTIALAGTMPFHEGLPCWSEKNRHEQHIVEQYIENTIAPLCCRMIKDGPRTVRAGRLMHLRTDFHFKMCEGITIGDVVERLHPTPAVCGMPKAEAREFILRNESNDRRYYSGFAGPLGLGGETHLFVTLRCMNIDGNRLTVYAGGGIMPDSQAEEEWRETELKMIW